MQEGAAIIRGESLMIRLHILPMCVNVNKPGFLLSHAGSQTVLIKVQTPMLYQEGCVSQHGVIKRKPENGWSRHSCTSGQTQVESSEKRSVSQENEVTLSIFF